MMIFDLAADAIKNQKLTIKNWKIWGRKDTAFF